MKIAVVVFPGSNCDHDAWHAFRNVLGVEAFFAWHKEADLKGADAVILPGGFSYGDYLRCGAIASLSPVMEEVVRFAKAGGPVLGICNGFQILCEAGLLPGALLANRSLKFICRDVHLRCDAPGTPFTGRLEKGQVIRMHIAHAAGNYFAPPETITRLEGEGRIAFRYTDPSGRLDPWWNFNGSVESIAGVLNEGRNVLGMMPHPERVSEEILGSIDGLTVLGSLVDFLDSATPMRARRFVPTSGLKPQRRPGGKRREPSFPGR
jgi:phosphoribosylformylglycinamidine synthase